jgi:hypothetical protein
MFDVNIDRAGSRERLPLAKITDRALATGRRGGAL